MGSAIPRHLQCPRTRNRRADENYAPPYPAYAARAHPSTKQVVMGYFGVQSLGTDMQGKACAALRNIVRGFGTTDGPGHHDLAHYVDAGGYDNMVAIAYWSDPASFARWRGGPVGDAWGEADEGVIEGVCYFCAIPCPPARRY